jgi:hypothetical protein
MDDADARREEHRRRVVRKANDENSKVDEVCSYNAHCMYKHLYAYTDRACVMCMCMCVLLCCAVLWINRVV